MYILIFMTACYYVSLQLVCKLFGFGTHCPLFIHIAVLGPMSTSSGFKQLNEIDVPTTAGSL